MSSRKPSYRMFLPLLAALGACEAQVEPNYEGEPLATLRGQVQTQGVSVAADVGVLWLLATENAACEGPELFCASSAWGSVGVEQTECAQACVDLEVRCTSETAPPLEACLNACGVELDIQWAWRTCGDAGIGDRAAVQGEFPASFTLDLLDPPPADALMDDGTGVLAALAYIAAVDPNAEDISVVFDGSDDMVPPGNGDNILGSVSGYGLLYAPAPIPETSGWGQYLGSAAPAGFHLVMVKDLGPECLNEECTSFSSTKIVHSLAPEGLDTELVLQMGEFETLLWPGI